MSVLVNASKDLEHAIIRKAHQFLFEWFHFLDCLDLALADTYDSELYVSAQLDFAVVYRIDIILFGALEILTLAVSCGA